MLSQNKQEQKEQCKAFMRLEVSNELESFYSKKNQPSILGEEKFLNWVKETFFRKKSDQEIPESKRFAPEINLINDIVATVYKVELSQLFVAKRSFENEPRNIAIYLARQLRGNPLKRIGEPFNLSRVSSVSSVLERVNRRSAIPGGKITI